MYHIEDNSSSGTHAFFIEDCQWQDPIILPTLLFRSGWAADFDCCQDVFRMHTQLGAIGVLFDCGTGASRVCGVFEALFASSWTLVYEYTTSNATLVLASAYHTFDHLALDAFCVLAYVLLRHWFLPRMCRLFSREKRLQP